MNNLRKKDIIITVLGICALVMMIFLDISVQRDGMGEEIVNTEETTEVVLETETEVESEGLTETESEMESELEIESESEVESEPEAESEIEEESESEIESETETESESELEPESETEIETEEVSEPEVSWIETLEVAQETTQIIIVAADGTYATVSMHTKDGDGVWKEDFSVEGRIGKNGIGKEQEGDGKTPTGVFRFHTAFGILPDPGVSALPYLQVDETHHWVDDSNSKYYNRLVSTRDVEVDWASSEHLYKSTSSYAYALALNYNIDCVPGLGSAIFLHCPSKSFGKTSGCIAIPEENMIQIMRLLQSDCVIIIDSKANVLNY